MCNELYNVKFHKLELIILIIYVFLTCNCFSLNEFIDVLSQINYVSSILSTLNKLHFRVRPISKMI